MQNAGGFGWPGWRSLFRWMGVVVLVVIATVALAACDDDEEDGDGGAATEPAETEPADGDEVSGLLEEAREQGFLTVGIANEAPYGFEDENGEATGEAPELARVILERLGIPELDAVVVDFGSLESGLAAGQFDMIAAGMFITPERAENTLFADPDYCGVQGFAVAEGNPFDIGPSFESLADTDAIVGVLGGAVEEGYVEEAGIPDDRIEVFDSTPNLFEALQDGRIDAVALTSITVNWQAQQLDGVEATEGFVYVDPEGNEQFGCGAFGFRPENQAFRDAFNDILVEMKQNDEILPIIQEFGFTAAEVNQAKDVTMEDLAGE